MPVLILLLFFTVMLLLLRVCKMGFLGQYHDIETGLYYNWHRYYNPSLGRYAAADPILHPTNGPPARNTCSQATTYSTFESIIFQPQKFNPYVYVSNAPINKFDPNGLEEACSCRVNCALRAFPNIYACVKDEGGWKISYVGLYEIHGTLRLLYIFTCDGFEKRLKDGEVL